ncbi:MAG TPA: DoxX family protein [Thermoplasmata archaeon]|jgi:nitrite reductase (NO-forming)
MSNKPTDDANASWWTRHVSPLNSILRILVGIVWTVDGALKFYSGFAGNFLTDLQGTQQSAPSWLSGWFTFWVNVTTPNPTAVVYTVGAFELLLGFALILGFMRKIAYAGGVLLALLIWSIPEGFGGLYTITPETTDIGTGILYAFAMSGLILINAAHGPSRWSLDYYIERRFPGWARIAEFSTPMFGRRKAVAPTAPQAPAA